MSGHMEAIINQFERYVTSLESYYFRNKIKTIIFFVGISAAILVSTLILMRIGRLIFHTDSQDSLTETITTTHYKVKHVTEMSTIADIDHQKENRKNSTEMGNINVGVEFWEVSPGCESQFKDVISVTLSKIDNLNRIFALTRMCIYKNMRDISKCKTLNKLTAIVGVKGGQSLDGRLPILRTYYELGARFMILDHNCDHDWARRTENISLKYALGLTKFGKDLIYEMNRIGMVIELSHTSYHVINDVLSNSRAPIILTCTIVNVVNQNNFISLEIMRKIRENNGIIVVVKYKANGSEEAPDRSVLDYFNTIYNITQGCSHIALRSRFKHPYISTEFQISHLQGWLVSLRKQDPKRWNFDCFEKMGRNNLLRVYQDVENTLIRYCILRNYSTKSQSETHYQLNMATFQLNDLAIKTSVGRDNSFQTWTAFFDRETGRNIQIVKLFN